MGGSQEVISCFANTGRIAGTVFCSVLALGHASPIVDLYEPGMEQRIIFENGADTYAQFDGMLRLIPGYTVINSKPYLKEICMNSEKNSNIEKLAQIADLEAGWDGDNANAFSDALISKVRNIIIDLQHQPELFPTACDTIQIEYEKESGAYLEIEIADADNAKVFSIDEAGNEAASTVRADAQEINKVVNAFYG